jgi:hypothetical protein
VVNSTKDKAIVNTKAVTIDVSHRNPLGFANFAKSNDKGVVRVFAPNG